MRETIESIAIAFVLAFLFRAFEAEAFVIPTGSMAPTLYGRHKDVVCEKCGYSFAVGASDEVDELEYLIARINTALCPNCRYENAVRDLPVFKGDRILVTKFTYEFTRPRRWDVAVFKYPEEPKTNYIKRIVGLPGETIVIKRGDLYRRREDGRLEILRKDDPDKQDRLQLPVYDHEYPEAELIRKGWPRRWVPVERIPVGGAVASERRDRVIAGWREATTGWTADDDHHAFQLTDPAASDGRLHWLRYRHIVPSPDVWQAFTSSPDPFTDPLMGASLRRQMQPELITDLCAYNAYTGGHSGQLYRDCYWVGDLTVSCRVTVQRVEADAELVLELNEGCRAYRCRIDLTSGEARLSIRTCFGGDVDDEQTLASAKTKMRGPGRYRLRFANVDNRLCLWLNRSLVSFGSAAEYELPETEYPGPQEEDLIPVGIAARNAELVVDDLLIRRDIYYRSEQIIDVDAEGFLNARYESVNQPELRQLLHDPQAWWEAYRAGMQTAEFQLGEDEYLVLGDNSPRSKDSRLWANTRHARHRYAVPASALVGKAFFVYWPHGKPFLRGGRGFPITYHKAYGPYAIEKTNYPNLRVPFYPQIGRMRRIR
ncbi:MAG TPA: signal peptidase I [Planctomycetaceae bacterium]|nr:signal peptidase I [Planctomycetaceae bacterium]